jgi:hypothetical protein
MFLSVVIPCTQLCAAAPQRQRAAQPPAVAASPKPAPERKPAEDKSKDAVPTSEEHWQ